MEITHENEAIIACHALEAEINKMQEDTGIVRRITWIDRGLHNFPDQLKAEVQAALDNVTDADRVLLGYGNCGNALAGITTGNFETIIPLVDDCISLLFGSKQARIDFSAEHAAFFLTEGWMDADHSIVQEYNYTVDKYGEDRANMITRMIYEHYRTMAYLDTNLYDIEDLMERTKKLCDVCEMKQMIHPVQLGYVEELITGPWPEDRFVHIPAEGKITSFA